MNLRQASNRSKRVIEAVNLLALIKQKIASFDLLAQASLTFPRNLVFVTFGELLIVFSTKINLLYLLYLTDPRCFLRFLLKQSCLRKTFLKTQILLTQFALYLLVLLGLISSCNSQIG